MKYLIKFDEFKEIKLFEKNAIQRYFEENPDKIKDFGLYDDWKTLAGQIFGHEENPLSKNLRKIEITILNKYNIQDDTDDLKHDIFKKLCDYHGEVILNKFKNIFYILNNHNILNMMDIIDISWNYCVLFSII